MSVTYSSRLYRVSHGDDVDKHCAQYFVNSALSPVLLFRRRIESVAAVLEGIRSKGFSQSWWNALLGNWSAVCRHGPCGPLSSLHPWDSGIPSDLHGFYKWVFDSLELLNDFLKQVVVSRRDVRVRKWTRWLREDLSSRPYVWLRPDFVPPPPFLRILKLSLLGFWLNLILLMLSFARPGYLFSAGLVIPSSLLISSWVLLVIFCLRSLIWIFLGLRVVTYRRWLVRKKSTAGGLDGWAWNEITALPLPCFSGLAILLELVESTGIWPQGLLDAYIATIPKADGDSTPLGQRPLSVLRLCTGCVQAVYRLWASLRLGHLREWVEGWLPKSLYSLGNGLYSVDAWCSTALDIEEVLSGTDGDQFHVMVADVIKSFDTVDRSILDCALGRLGLPDWFS